MDNLNDSMNGYLFASFVCLGIAFITAILLKGYEGDR